MASQDPSISSIEELVTCQLCESVYTAPVSLACLHVFCKACILQHFGVSSAITCPKEGCGRRCRNTQVNRDERTEELVRLFKGRFEEKQRMATTEMKCDLCGKKEAKWLCEECGDATTHICNGPCGRLHSTVGILKKHRLISIEDAKRAKRDHVNRQLDQLEPLLKLCVEELTALSTQSDTANRFATRVSHQIKKSEEMWVKKVKQIHQMMYEEVRKKSEFVLRGIGEKKQELSLVQANLSNKAEEWKQMLSENNTRDLLSNDLNEQLEINMAEIAERVQAIRINPEPHQNFQFQAMTPQTKNELEAVMSLRIREQLHDVTGHGRPRSTEVAQLQDPSARPLPSLKKGKKQKSDGANICSLRRLVKAKDLSLQHIYQFRKMPSPNRLKIIDNELWILLTSGQIRVLKLTADDGLVENDITVFHNRRDSESPNAAPWTEYHATAVAGLGSHVVIALERQIESEAAYANNTSLPGLVLISSSGQIHTEIATGAFVDVCVDNQTVYGLPCHRASIANARPTIQVHKIQKKKWRCIRVISLEDEARRVLVLDSIIYTSSLCESVMKYNTEDDSVQRLTLTKRPRTVSGSVSTGEAAHFRLPLADDSRSDILHCTCVCFADPQRNVMVLDSSGNSLNVLSPRDNWREVTLVDDVDKPIDADMDGNGDLWIVAKGTTDRYAIHKIVID